MLNTTLHKQKKKVSKKSQPKIHQITISKYINDKYALKSVELGTGSFGDVYLGEETDPITRKKRDVAIKRVRLERYGPEHFKYLVAEIEIMAGCQNEFVMSLVDKIEIPRKELYLVMDLCEANFKYYMNNARKKWQDKRLPLLSEKEIQYWIKQISSGLGYLHLEKKICHRDIKPHNLLLKKKGHEVAFNFYAKIGNYDEYTILISDFGLSKVLDSNPIAETILGTQCYRSPQLALFQPYSFDADIFALGVVLFEMIAGYCLFGAQVTNPKPKYGEIISTLTENIDWSFLSDALDISPELVDLLSGMLQFEVEKRFNIEQILQHPFLNMDFSESEVTTTQVIPSETIPTVSYIEIPLTTTTTTDNDSPNNSMQQQQQVPVQIILPTSEEEQEKELPVNEPIQVIQLERDEPTPTTFSEFVSFSYERVGLPQDYTRVSIIKDEIGSEPALVKTEKISKSKHSKVLILLSSDSNKAINYSIKVLESPVKHTQTGTVSSTVEYELENIEMEMITLEFEFTHSLTNRWLSYFTTPEQIPFTIEIYVQSRIPEHTSTLSIESIN